MEKIKKIFIDLEEIQELNMSLTECGALIDFYLNNKKPSKDLIKGLVAKEFIREVTDNSYVLDSKIRRYLHSISLPDDSVKPQKKTPDEDLKKLIKNRLKEYRSKWKETGKPGAMGSPSACKDNLYKWMKENPEYSFDDILKAADLYIQTEGRNTRFLQRADYFIYKHDVNKVKHSRLSAFIEEIDNGYEEDWTTEIN